MTRPFTPTDEQAKSLYVVGARNAFIASTSEHEAEWDRWIKEHDREVVRRFIASQERARRRAMSSTERGTDGLTAKEREAYAEHYMEKIAKEPNAKERRDIKRWLERRISKNL